MPPGARLRSARERQGLTLAQVAARTRISVRHLEAIEQDQFVRLPGRTYALGFARNYARALGLAPEPIVEQVRLALGDLGAPVASTEDDFAPGDPTRAPGAGLVRLSLLALVLLLAGIFFAARQLFAPAAELPPIVNEEPAPTPAPVLPSPSQPGQVRFTAQGPVWVRFTDAGGVVLREGEMAPGETFVIPSGTNGPELVTGRPDLLAITIDGRPVAPLSDRPVTMSKVPVSASALLARERPATTATPPPDTPPDASSGAITPARD